MTDSAYVLDYLERHPRGADAMEIISASIRDRGVGLTCHSRISDLRAQGYTITCQVEGKTRKGRDRYVYRLVAAGPDHPACVARRERDAQTEAAG